MTERLYYTDSKLLEFTGTIVETGSDERGHWTVLDRSAFYPTSGGQQHDTGTINSVAVVDVIESDEGEVLHITSQPCGTSGQSVIGIIDGDRRRRHRQAHTAQHILSASFDRLFGLLTCSVHLGAEYSAVELEAETIPDSQLIEAEALANRIVRENVEVETVFIEADKAASLPLRKPPQKTGTLRIIRIGDYEYSACGGTHCSSSAETGIIKIIATERIRGRTLVKYLCGDLAFEDYRTRFEVTDSLSRKMTCAPIDIPGRVEKLTEEHKGMSRQLATLQKELLPGRAKEIVKSAVVVEGVNLVMAEAEDLNKALVGQLAGMVADEIGGLAVVYSEGRLVFAAAESGELSAGDLVKAFVARTGLKGGGNRRQAQVGGAERSNLKQYKREIESLLGHG